MKNFIFAGAFFLILCACKEKNTDHSTGSSHQQLQYSSEITATKQEPSEIIESAGNDSLMIVKGKRDLKSVEKEIRDHLISVQFWYHRKYGHLKEEKRVTVSFTIDELGVPHQPKLVSSEMSDSQFVMKIIDDISLWRFAKYPNGSDTTEVTYPITLRPGSQPQE